MPNPENLDNTIAAPDKGFLLVAAKPVRMSRQEYCIYRGWELPANEWGADIGYLMEYESAGEKNHPDHAAYISWLPEFVYQRAFVVA